MNPDGSAHGDDDRLRRINETTATVVILSQIAIGATYYRIARSECGERRLRALALANSACDLAEQWLLRVDLKQPKFSRITTDAEKLRFDLERLVQR